MNISKAELCQLLPHTDTMCLLHEVTAWDAGHIACLAINHSDPANPLRHNGRLPAHCAIEYAAQAMAVHGGLATRNGSKPRVGFIGSVRDVKLHVQRLDDILAPLEIVAIKQLADANHSLYELRVCAAGRELMTGRAAVFLQRENQA
ncbi:MAG: 3-hydroxylacyl-ACP dehydratase [Sulfuricella sp.]|jgi:predicted hotdog family 3-hydroxylacyl-ACP dehydratase|nr:3-hydroxylacyl-ACP dehydratase [Sulfuricella sp.]